MYKQLPSQLFHHPHIPLLIKYNNIKEIQIQIKISLNSIMDIERPHRTPTTTTTTTSELFICFTSRLSKSSSMRLSSKSILSPARTTTDKATQPPSLSTSLSRRLRHNGSLRGAQSPAMFPSKKNRGGSGFADNPEPSSPKVTCIGQVRVKTKKQGKKMKMRACRSKRLSGGEASFRRIEHPLDGTNANANGIGIQSQQSQDRNQRWVHLPLTICEALRAFGNEFSCLLPCKSSCFSGGEKGGKSGEDRENEDSSCAVFRWLVSLQEGEGKRRDIELVVGGGEEEQVVKSGGESIVMERECSRRRSIFDDMEFDDLFKDEGEIFNDNNGGGGDEESGRRVSLCMPPKNALLLMRCRSDPVKMASLSRKLWDVAPLPAQDDGDDDDDDANEDDKDGDVEERVECEINEVKLEENIEVIDDKNEEIEEQFLKEIGEEREKIEGMLDVWVEAESNLEDLPCLIEEDGVLEEEKPEENLVEEEEQNQGIENIGKSEEQECEIPEQTSNVIKDETLESGCSIEENEQNLSCVNLEEQQELVNGKVKESLEIDDVLVLVEMSNATALDKEESTDLSTSTTTSSCSNSSEESTAESKEREEEKDPIEQEHDSIEVEQEEQIQLQVQEPRKSMEEKPKENNTKPTLPDCLLLMMCEPKVSMEVSKETWVCTTDFLKWLPERHPKKAANKLDGSDESTKKKKLPPVQPSAQRLEPPAQAPVQPGRSSFSFPAGGGSVANMIEQKLGKGGAGGYEPLVLTRCKSAPMRSAAAKIAPSEMTCSLWGRENGRKLKPHRPATFGVGAAGVGF